MRKKLGPLESGTESKKKRLFGLAWWTSQENFKAGALRQKVGKITIIHLKDPHVHHRCSLCSVDGRWACKNFEERDGAGTRAAHMTAADPFAFKPHENRNFGAIICLDNVTFWSRGTALRVRLTVDQSLSSESETTLPQMLATGLAVCENTRGSERVEEWRSKITAWKRYDTHSMQTARTTNRARKWRRRARRWMRGGWRKKEAPTKTNAKVRPWQFSRRFTLFRTFRESF